MDTIYKDKSKEELDLLVSNFGALTIDAKRDLLGFLKNEGRFVNDDLDIGRLESDIAAEEAMVKSFHYLKNLGYDLDNQNDRLAINRSKRMRRMDVFTLIFGFLLMLILPQGIYGWYWTVTNEEYEFGIVFGHLINTKLGVVGTLLVLRAAGRIEKYWSRSLVATGNEIALLKGNKTLVSTSDPEDLLVQESEETIALYLRDGELKEEVVEVQKPNLYFRQTVHELKSLFSNRLNK